LFAKSVNYTHDNTYTITAIIVTNINIIYKNSSGNEIANVNFYAVRPQATRILWNNENNGQGHRFWYQSKAHIRFSISDYN